MRYRARSLFGLPLLVCAFATPAVRADAPATILAYQLKPGEPLRYKLTAKIKASVPFLDSPAPVDLDAVITMVYVATPKTLLANGSSDVEFRVDDLDVKLADLPVPIGVEDVQKILNQKVVVSPSGEIRMTGKAEPLPFNVSIPGVDPSRLYALLFPIVFQKTPVKAGDTWSFKSDLLGGEGASPEFKATLLEPVDDGALARLRESLSMKVDQKLGSDRKPVNGDKPAHRTRKGLITGTGDLNFSTVAGRFTKSVVKLKARIVDDLLGKPATPDEPKQVVSKVDATVTIELQPAAAAAADKKKGTAN